MTKKEILENLNKWKFILVILVIIFCAFYWFQLRSTLARRQCSWLTQLEAGTPAVPEVTKEEAGRENAQNIITENKNRADNNCDKNDAGFFCSLSFSTVYPSPAIPAGADKWVTREATRSEYDMCLRNHGL